MIPVAIAAAAEEHGWRTHSVIGGSRGTWITLRSDGRTVDIWRDRWRHTSARAYRGNALSGILRTQRQVVEFLSTAT